MRTVTMDDGTILGCYGRDGFYAPTRDDKRYRLRNGFAVAWRIVGECVDLRDDIDPDTGEFLGQYPDPTGRVCAVMVGDNAIHVYDRDDFETIEEDDYCHECGQIGCTHDGRDRA